MKPQFKRLNNSLIIIFFFSGIAGLIYEIVWVRFLTMFVGGSAFSISIVLTIFMAGLALGSRLAARITDRFNNPHQMLMFYGLIELLIGFYGFLFILIMSTLNPLYALVYNKLSQHYMLYNIVSATISMLVLIIPTTLMGATLPILSKYYMISKSNLGAKTGKLYGMNTLGGALGSLLAGIFLIHYLGVTLTLYTAIAINLIIGMLCYLYSTKHADIKNIFTTIFTKVHKQKTKYTKKTIIYLILIVSGFCSMAYEVIWTKLLALLAGPTTYSFSIVLFTFIVGLALGSILFGYIADKTKNRILLLVLTQLLAAFLVLITSQIMGNSNLFFAKLLYENRNNFMLIELFKTLSLFSFMILPTMCLGAVFPIIIKIQTENIERIGNTVGNIYAINTVGALFGSFCAGFLLIPLFGKNISLSILIIIQTVTACLVYVLYNYKKFSFIYIGSVSIIILSFLFPRWNPTSFIHGRYLRFSSHEKLIKNNSYAKVLFKGQSIIQSEFKDPDVLYFKDGIGGFVAACQSINSLDVHDIYISSSGKMEGSIHGDWSTMGLSAHYPLLLHPNAEDVLVIGLGTGITAGEALHYPIKNLDVVEISPEVVEASKYFLSVNNDFSNDPRTTLYIQDARTHLTLSNRMYDVVSSEPSNPWMAGVANLYTKEYFEKVKNHLKANGIFVQWYHAYQSDWEIYSLVGRTITSVFPNTVLIKTKKIGGDFLFIAFKDDNAKFDPDIINKNLKYANASPHISIDKYHVLYPLIVAENTKSMFGTGLMHTDNHPYLEYQAPYYMYNDSLSFLHKINERGKLTRETSRILKKFSEVEYQIAFTKFLSYMNVFNFNDVNRSEATQEQLEQLRGIERSFYSKNIIPYYFINDSSSLRLCLQIHENKFKEFIIKSDENNYPDHIIANGYFDLGKLYGGTSKYDKALPCLTKAYQLDPDNADIQTKLSYCYEEMKQYSKAITIQSKLLERYPTFVPLLSSLTINYLKLRTGNKIYKSDVENALKYANKTLRIDPENKRMQKIRTQIMQYLNR